MDPSLALLIAACRFGFEGGDPAVLRERLRGSDGALLGALAMRHRVEGIVWRSLKACSVALAGTETIAERAQRTAAEGLRMALESGRINRAFAGSSLPHLFLKGQTLGALAWGDPLIKRQADIDLLVSPTAITKASALLGSLGYVLEEPDPSVDAADWHRRHKESLWRSDDGLMLDLHSRVADHPAVLPRLTAAVPAMQVEVAGGIRLPTLSSDWLLPYLAVHGTSSAWFRLKWLADFAAIVHRTDPAMLERLAERAPALGAGRTLSAALVLSSRLFGTRIPEGMWFDGGAARLVAIALKQIADPREPTQRRFGTLGIHHSQLLMVPGSHFVIGEALRQMGSALIR